MNFALLRPMTSRGTCRHRSSPQPDYDPLDDPAFDDFGLADAPRIKHGELMAKV